MWLAPERELNRTPYAVANECSLAFRLVFKFPFREGKTDEKEHVTDDGDLAGRWRGVAARSRASEN
jgi:hypothetical protein